MIDAQAPAAHYIRLLWFGSSLTEAAFLARLNARCPRCTCASASGGNHVGLNTFDESSALLRDFGARRADELTPRAFIICDWIVWSWAHRPTVLRVHQRNVFVISANYAGNHCKELAYRPLIGRCWMRMMMG